MTGFFYWRAKLAEKQKAGLLPARLFEFSDWGKGLA
jgi:hypothetical protein